MFLHVVELRHIEAFVLEVTFNDSSVRRVDLAEDLHGEVFEPLRDPTVFAGAFVNPETGTVEWPNGADLAPEFLWERGVAVRSAA